MLVEGRTGEQWGGPETCIFSDGPVAGPLGPVPLKASHLAEGSVSVSRQSFLFLRCVFTTPSDDLVVVRRGHLLGPQAPIAMHASAGLCQREAGLWDF